ncbi:MAG: OmpA family protein [Draconibacterium sp.]
MTRIIYIVTIILISVVSVSGQQKHRMLLEDVNLVIEPIKSINTVGSDISPFFVGDELYFSSIRNDYFNKDSRERKNKAFYDIYEARVDRKGYLEPGERKLVRGFGAEYHEGPASYCEKTGELFVTLSNIINPDSIIKMLPLQEIRLRLVIMEKQSGEWRITKELPFNSNTYNCAQPAISAGGDTLVFSSDMDSMNFGKNDLFMSVRDANNSWSAPVNLGDKVNSPGHEMFPTFLEDGILAFSSDYGKEALGGLDIYYTSFPKISEIQSAGNKINTRFDDFGLIVHPNREVGYFASNRGNVGSDDIYRIDIHRLYRQISGKVVNDLTNEGIESATVTLFDCNGNKKQELQSGVNGEFSIEITASDCPLLTANKDGYIEGRIDAEGLNFIELRLKPIQKRELIVLDFDTRLPVTEASISCNETGLYGLTTELGLFQLHPPFPVGQRIEILKDGYLNQSLIMKEVPLQVNFVRDTVLLYKKEENKSFTLDNIYYDFDKWDILPESEVELDKLVQILNDNPDIKVELGSHTDSRGSDSYNQALSQKRSESAVKYIISKGIDASRIIAKGYGETQLINKCSNGVQCSDWEHRQNRRTEFKIIEVMDNQ